MRVLARRWLPVVTLASLLLPAVVAAGVAADGAEPADARAWLARIHAAAQQRNYQGTMVFSAGGLLSSSRVAHFCVGDDSYERLESLDGRQQRIYRHNDVVQTVWPQSRVAVVEHRSPLSGLPSSTQAVEPRALEQYELRREEPDRIAGRDAFVFLLQPRDELRYAQRVWADKATGLMLRADVIGPNRNVLESSAFSEIEIGIRPQPDTVMQGLRRLEGLRVVRPAQQRTQLEAEGWAIAHTVPGFRLIGCVRRALDGADAPADEAPAADQVLQAVFSDGVTHVSLFIEPYEPRRRLSDLNGQIGATGALRQRRGDHWVTVMGDVPAPTLKAFADALERRR